MSFESRIGKMSQIPNPQGNGELPSEGNALASSTSPSHEHIPGLILNIMTFHQNAKLFILDSMPEAW